MTEPNPRYHAHQEDWGDYNGHIEQWKKEGTYPPKLTAKEKQSVDLAKNRTVDENGNLYVVVWNLGGRPTRAKQSPSGKVYMWNGRTKQYERQNGCFGKEVLS